MDVHKNKDKNCLQTTTLQHIYIPYFLIIPRFTILVAKTQKTVLLENSAINQNVLFAFQRYLRHMLQLFFPNDQTPKAKEKKTRSLQNAMALII